MEKEKEVKNEDKDITIVLKQSEVYQVMLSLMCRAAEAKVKASLTFDASEYGDMNGLAIYLDNLEKKISDCVKENE